MPPSPSLSCPNRANRADRRGRQVRAAWERHGSPQGLRALLELELAAGVQQPTRLAEGSAALALLWSMRMKRFWTHMADGFADTASTEATSAFGIRAYEREVCTHGLALLHDPL